MSGEYSVDELLQQRVNILQEIVDNDDEINSDNTCWHCDATSDVSVV